MDDTQSPIRALGADARLVLASALEKFSFRGRSEGDRLPDELRDEGRCGFRPDGLETLAARVHGRLQASHPMAAAVGNDHAVAPSEDDEVGKVFDQCIGRHERLRDMAQSAQAGALNLSWIEVANPRRRSRPERSICCGFRSFERWDALADSHGE